MAELEFRQMRLEFNRDSFKDELREKLGCECVNCGSTFGVEYHHIVPLRAGGSNRISNIVPLCHVCHKIVHDTKNIRKVYGGSSGRKKGNPVEGYKDIVNDYLFGLIGYRECRQRLGLGRSTKLTEKWYVKEYIQEIGIEKHRNKIDLLSVGKNKNAGDKNRIIAFVKYSDGRIFERYEDGTTKVS